MTAHLPVPIPNRNRIRNHIRNRNRGLPLTLALLALAAFLLLAGCATASIQSRQAERRQAFSALSPQQQQLVSKGQIAQGMDTNAVYVALGPPSKVKQVSPQDILWIYYSGYNQRVPTWTYMPIPPLGYYDYHTAIIPQRYVSIQVIFHDNRVASWQQNPPPGP